LINKLRELIPVKDGEKKNGKEKKEQPNLS